MRNVPIKEHVRIVLQKMFEGTGIEYSDEYVKQEFWYWNYSWSKKEQQAYIDWLTDYLYKNKEARKQIMTVPIQSKPLCKKAAESFTDFFGWADKQRTKKVKETKETNQTN